MTKKRTRYDLGVEITPSDTTTDTLTRSGELAVDVNDNELKVYLDSAQRTVVTEDQAQVLTNKTIDADNSTISNLEVDNLKAGVLNTSTSLTGASNTQLPSALAVKTYVDDNLALQNEASEISYDNTTSGLAATDVQAAIDEVDFDLDSTQAIIANHIADTTDAHDASAISNIPSGNLAATDVQGALNELQTDIDTVSSGAAAALSGHINDAVDAHDASAISNIPSGNLAATDVQTALNELQSDIDTRATSTALNDHIIDSVDAHDASAISNIPTGNLVATDVQGALDELQTDVDTRRKTAENLTLSNLYHIEVQSSTDSVTTGTNASLGAFTAGAVRLMNGSLVSLANIPAGANGQELIIFNRTGAAISVVDSSAALGTAANRIFTGTSGNITFANNAALILSYDSVSSRWQVIGGTGGGSGEIGVNTLLQQTFENASLSDFTQTGLSLATTPNILIKSAKVALLTHQSGSPQSFKQTIAVDNKFKNYSMVATLDVRSTATSGNVTILFRDETNSADIGTSQQIATGSQSISVTTTSGLATLAALTNSQIATLSVGMSVTGSGIPAGTTILSINTSTFVVTLSANATASATVTARFSSLPSTKSFSFTIPANCSSLSYTVTALAEANAPETYIDNIVIQLSSAALLSTSVVVPKNNDTEWASYTPTFTGFGTVTGINMKWRRSNAELLIEGVFTVGTPTAVEARIGFPSIGVTSLTTLPSLSTVGTMVWNGSNSTSILLTTLIEPSVNYMTYGGVQTTQTMLTKRNGNDFFSPGTTTSIKVSIPIAGWSANETETKTIPLTSSVIVTQPDSVFARQGHSGWSSSTFLGINIKITTSNFRTSLGDAISFTTDATNGDRYTLLKSGIYHIDASMEVTTADAYLSLLADNDRLQTSSAGQEAGEYYGTLSATQYFNAGTVIRIGGGAAYSGGTNDRVSISYKGSSQIINPSSDQKIEIPTHQLRFEGSSSRGATDTVVVKFDTQTSIKGDAWDVVNTAANGTVVTMKKAGRLTIHTNLYVAINTNQIITLNATNLTSFTRDSSVLTEVVGGSGSLGSQLSAQVDVKVGDKIRVISTINPNSLPTNSLNLSLMETSIAVALQNVSPNWDNSDSAVELSSGNGFGSGTFVYRFSNVNVNFGTDITYIDSSANGSSFTANKDGLYDIQFSFAAASANEYFGLSKNQSNLTLSMTNIPQSETLALFRNNLANDVGTVSIQRYLLKGDIIRPLCNNTQGNNFPFARFAISKVGKTSGTVDVTPFVNIPTQKTQFLRMNTFNASAPSSASAICLFDNVETNTNNGIFKVESDSTLGTRITALVDCIVEGGWNGAFIDAQDCGWSVNSTQLSTNLSAITVANRKVLTRFAASLSTFAPISTTLKAGDILRPHNGSSGSRAGVPSNYFLELTATSVATSVATQTQQVSSDTMNFSFKSTAINPDTDAIGTFNTYTYGANNTKTLATSAPTQSIASMNTNGIQLFGKAFNASSTAANPARFEIFIGKNLKSKQVDAYGNLLKTTPASYDLANTGSFARFDGTFVYYNEITGILTLDAAFDGSGASTARFVLSGEAANTTGYFVFNASQTPSLVSIPNLAPRIAYLSDVKTSGTVSVGSTAGVNNTRELNTLNDPTGIITSLASNQFILQAGTYDVNALSAQYQGNAGKLRLRNITDSSTAILGTNIYNTVAANVVAAIGLNGQFTITSAKTFEIQHFMNTTLGGSAYGIAASSGENEIYMMLKITKIK